MTQSTTRNKQTKKERHRVKRDQEKKQTRKKRQIREASEKGKEVIYQIAKTINHFFPKLWGRVNDLTDPRKKSLNIQ